MMTAPSFQSQVVMTQTYPLDQFDLAQCFLLYDKATVDKAVVTPERQDFVDAFPYKLGVRGGEGLKNFNNFPKQLDRIIKAFPQPIRRSHTMVALGGGSLGDFAGFVASILQRGIRLNHIPSTWLAAMDSAHGGKTGCNYAGRKNQLGTFYPAHKIFVIRPLLQSVPDAVKAQSYGELIKMALIGESQFFREIVMEKRPALDFLWRFLPLCIEDKYSVVLRDPFESQQIRQVLNFGHTLGHAFEAHFSWAHGDAVVQGVFFALRWSVERGFLSQLQCDQFFATIAEKFDRVPAIQCHWFKKPSAKTMKKHLLADKKLQSDASLLFVFLKNIGQPHLEKVSVAEILAEMKRQGWVK